VASSAESKRAVGVQSDRSTVTGKQMTLVTQDHSDNSSSSFPSTDSLELRSPSPPQQHLVVRLHTTDADGPVRHDEDKDEDQAADADENEVAVLSMEVP